MSIEIKTLRPFRAIFRAAALLGILLCPPAGVFAAGTAPAADREMEALKPLLERRAAPPVLVRRYGQLLDEVNDCAFKNFAATLDPEPLFSPAASFCLNGSLAVGDPTYNRPTSNSSGTGFGASCTPSGSATAVHYDAITFNLSSCAVFPTVVTASLCGPAGCTALQSFDSVLLLYRNVPAGDPLTANGGLAGAFNPAAPCTNARALNDDTGATPTSPGGSTCNQLNTSDCTAGCSPSTSLSQMKRSLGDGRFTLVVTTFSNGATANYNLYVNAPAAGCVVELTPTAAPGTIAGRVASAGGRGIYNAVVTVSGGGLAAPLSVRTNPFGYYNLRGLPAGETYVVTVGAKGSAFANPSRVVELTDSLAEVDFTSLD